jgi:hypothetical protein
MKRRDNVKRKRATIQRGQEQHEEERKTMLKRKHQWQEKTKSGA